MLNLCYLAVLMFYNFLLMLSIYKETKVQKSDSDSETESEIFHHYDIKERI